jgi:hypothetical protein
MYLITEAGKAYMQLCRQPECGRGQYYLIPEAGGAYMELCSQPEGGGGD